ncbi:uncharacterized protein LOC125210077 [Salvia hispanica]|uniref:uncharacterized protein LOC125210077 n=1 Tax=Salvia hispanica TaxID=49212 RepID=UPI00200969B6|nr:uncharacterized protein LOC125210077 [Salvia hispanica]
MLSLTAFPCHLLPPPQHRSLTLTRCNPENGADLSPPPQKIRPPESVEIRFKRGSRRRRRQEEDGGVKKAVEKQPKDWDSMNLSEKAMELYVGEKGLLFWLNKFAYASIFIVIGGWILFRFVGPALDLYQLDAPPFIIDYF